MTRQPLECRLDVLNVADIEATDRVREDYQDLEEIKASMTENGLIHPIAVMEVNGKFKLLAGGRRLKAAQELGWASIACNIYPELDPLMQKAIELKENIHRTGLLPVEQAKLVKQIHDLHVELYGEPSRLGTGQRLADTAKLLGRSVASVSTDIKIATMAELVPELSKCPTKDAASKLIQRAANAVSTERKVKEFEDKTGIGLINSDKERLTRAYVVGDFFELVKNIPDNSISLIELDPIYHMGLNKLKKGASFDSLYKEGAFADYEDFLTRATKECFRIMSPNSWLLCWYSIRFHHEITAKVLESCGLVVNRLPNIWYKHYGQTLLPEYNLASTYDTFLSCRKGIPALKSQGRSNVFDCRPIVSQYKVHPTERPIQLVQTILGTFASPGDAVLVPFAGSGNTLLAAGNLHMPCIGFDLVKEYQQEYLLKVHEGIPTMYVSPIAGDATDA